MNLFKDHPTENGMTYTEHCKGALSFGTRLIKAGVMAIVHAIFPFIFKHDAGNEVEKLYKRLQEVREGEKRFDSK